MMREQDNMTRSCCVAQCEDRPSFPEIRSVWAPIWSNDALFGCGAHEQDNKSNMIYGSLAAILGRHPSGAVK